MSPPVLTITSAVRCPISRIVTSRAISAANGAAGAATSSSSAARAAAGAGCAGTGEMTSKVRLPAGRRRQAGAAAPLAQLMNSAIPINWHVAAAHT